MIDRQGSPPRVDDRLDEMPIIERPSRIPVNHHCDLPISGAFIDVTDRVSIHREGLRSKRIEVFRDL